MKQPYLLHAAKAFVLLPLLVSTHNFVNRTVLQFILAPFFDLGTVWNNDDNPNPLPDQNLIAALGLGVIWQPINNLNIRLDYAPPLVDLSDRGDNIQNDGLHFSVSYSQKI